MAATISFSFCSNRRHAHPHPHSHSHLYTHPLKSPVLNPFRALFITSSPPKPAHPLLLLHEFDTFKFYPACSSSHSSSSSESYLDDPLRTGRFLSSEEAEKLQILHNFRYSHEVLSGSLLVRVMRAEEMGITVGLLSESFGESMSLPSSYVRFLAFLVNQYLIGRRALIPHTATLIGFYRGEDGEEELAGTVEISFNNQGASVSPPTPTPPKDSPYICNMTVKKQLRRRGIGWHLLKACEELIPQMSCTSREVYLHCRMIDTAPFKMYTKAGYTIVETDNIFILLTFQRRKHLMCKRLSIFNDHSDMDITNPDEEFPHEGCKNE